MNETQRSAAERLAFEQWYDAQPDGRIDPWDVWQAATLLRELAAEPVQAPDLVRDFPAVKAAKKAAEAELGYYREMMAAEPMQEPVAAELPAPQLLVESAQGFVEGWARSQVRSAINLALLKRRYAAPQQRKPLSMDDIKRCVDEAHGRGLNTVDQLSDFTVKLTRAIERAHDIT